MELDKIGAELEQVRVLVEGWKHAGRIDDLERDLALEKLRRIYENVRFAAAVERNAESESEPTVEIPVNLDLDRMLGIVPLPGEEAREPLAQRLMTDAAEGLSEDAAAEEHVPVSETADASAPRTAEPIIRPVSAAGPEERAVPEQTVAADPGTDPVSEPLRGSVPEPVDGPVPGPDAPRPAAARQTVIEPALFGMDEIVQHKRKQRVIMSLYDEHGGTVQSAPDSAAKREPLSGPEVETTKQTPEVVPDSVPTPQPLSEPVRIPGTEPEAQRQEVVEAAPASSGFDRKQENVVAAQMSVQGAVLGETINRGVQTLGETIAPPRDVVSDIAHKAPVSDLREAIGINDKFLLIRDLFDGDAAACDAAIDRLNGFADLDDCMIHIAEHYAWNPNSDGARLLVELLERKLA